MLLLALRASKQEFVSLSQVLLDPSCCESNCKKWESHTWVDTDTVRRFQCRREIKREKLRVVDVWYFYFPLCFAVCVWLLYTIHFPSHLKLLLCTRDKMLILWNFENSVHFLLIKSYDNAFNISMIPLKFKFIFCPCTTEIKDMLRGI